MKEDQKILNFYFFMFINAKFVSIIFPFVKIIVKIIFLSF